MQELIDGLTLYHGSYCEVMNPELCQGARYKDFGQGFYLTSSKEQAKCFTRISVKKAILNGKIDAEQKYGIVSAFKFALNDKLSIRIFPEADADWLHCIAAHRRKNTFPGIVKEMKKYDIIAGKITGSVLFQDRGSIKMCVICRK